jgi:hypothetical protein
MKGKPFYKSKTLWFNILIPLLTLVGKVVTDEIDTETFLNELMPVVLIIGNIILRFLTREPVKIRKNTGKEDIA